MTERSSTNCSFAGEQTHLDYKEAHDLAKSEDKLHIVKGILTLFNRPGGGTSSSARTMTVSLGTVTATTGPCSSRCLGAPPVNAVADRRTPEERDHRRLRLGHHRAAAGADCAPVACYSFRSSASIPDT